MVPGSTEISPAEHAVGTDKCGENQQRMTMMTDPDHDELSDEGHEDINDALDREYGEDGT